MRQPPKLAKHKARGVYFIKYGGKFIYFSKDPVESRRLYLAHLDEHWLPYAQAKARQCGPTKDSLRVVELAEHYLTHVLTDRSRKLMVDYRGYLAEFIRAWGALPVEKMEAQLLQDMKTDMAAAGYKPRSINHAVKAVKRMFRWGEEMGLAPHVRLDGVKTVKVPRPAPSVPGYHAVFSIIRQALDLAPPLAPWLAVNYLACMRPSEVVRLAHRRGDFVAEGVFRMESKTQAKTGAWRHVILSDEALGWFRLLEPRWKDHVTYSEAMRDAFGPGGPRQLRAWGATHLRRAGVPAGDIAAILGHTLSGSLPHYVEEDWARLRPVVARLTLRLSSASSLEAPDSLESFIAHCKLPTATPRRG